MRGVFQRRARLLVGLFCLWALGLIAALVRLQVVESEVWVHRAERLHYTFREIEAEKGQIYDTHGRLLGLRQVRPYVSGDPSLVASPRKAARLLAAGLNKSRSWQDRVEGRFKDKSRRFVYLARDLSLAEAGNIEKLALPRGVFLGREYGNRYPNGRLAAHVLGFANRDGNFQEGLEQTYREVLAGRNGKVKLERDGRGRVFQSGVVEIVQTPINGRDLELTLDADIQYILARALREFAGNDPSAIATVMDPRDGRILAMAGLPDFDPNHFADASASERGNRAVMHVFEPAGSLRPLVMAAALDLGTVGIDQTFNSEPKKFQIFNREFTNGPPFGALGLAEILAHGNNQGAIGLVQTLRPADLRTALVRFGFGNKTGIDLPAESPGILSPLDNWTRLSREYIGLGHEVSVTQVQLLTAMCSMVNGGLLVKPHVVARIWGPAGAEPVVLPAPKRVLGERTAAHMAAILRKAAQMGPVADRLEGADILGLCANSRAISQSGYSAEKTIGTYTGFFPAPSPRIAVQVVVFGEGKTHVRAADVFARVRREILRLDSVNQVGKELIAKPEYGLASRPERVAPVQAEGMPELRGLGLREILVRVRGLGLQLNLTGQGVVMGQEPALGEPLPANRTVTVTLAPVNGADEPPRRDDPAR